MHKVFRTIIAIGVILRIYIALSRNDLVWPDEHYQTIEPAGRIVWGFGFQAWEWVRGFRSWLGPLPYVPIFFILKLFGIKGGAIAIYSARVFVALLSGISVYVFDRFLSRLDIKPRARFLALSFFAFHPAYLLWGVTTLSDHLALDVLVFITPYLYFNPLSFISGLLLGALFLTRFQTIAWMPGFALYLLLFERPKLKPLLQAACGYLICILIFGAVDWITWGAPFKSILNQLTEGLKISEQYGKHPPTQYFQYLYENLGLPSLIVISLSFFASFISQNRRKLAFFMTLPSLSFLGVHMALAHKEARFILPLYFSFALFVALGAETVLTALEKYVFKVQEYVYFIFIFFMTIVGLAGARNTSLYLTPVNIFDLEEAAHKDGMLFLPGTEKCIITVSHNWSWARGHLMQGIAFDFHEINPDSLANRPTTRCPYAIVHDSRKTQFIEKSQEKWEFMLHAHDSPFTLYKQVQR